MTKFSFLFSLCIFASVLLSAQKSYVVDTINTNNDLSQYNSGEWYMHRRVSGGLEGSGFVFEKFMNGRIMVNDTTLSSETYSMNVDAYTNEVKYMQAGKEYTIYNTNKYMGVLMMDSLNQRYLFKRIPLSGTDKTLYLVEVMHTGTKYTLYKHLGKRLHRANFQDNGVYTTGKSVNSFDEYTDYYIKKAHGQLEQIKLKKSNFLELAASSKTSKLENYCTENKIGKNLTEQQAVQLIRIIETL